MSTYERLNRLFAAAPRIPFHSDSKLVFIGDCHRGDGSWADDFNHNQSIYYAAVEYYYKGGFTYFDMGDSDELWKNRSFAEISTVYIDIFRLLHKFYTEDRYYMLYGNHDMAKRNPAYVKKYLRQYYNNRTDGYEPLFEGITVHEALVLVHEESGTQILLVHGHQGDIFADVFWKLARFLDRYIWNRFGALGFHNPTRAATNYDLKRKVEKKFLEWVDGSGQSVIVGHTHRPVCPPDEIPPYFNAGSCVHPNCITCIEIINAKKTLVRWGIKTREDRTLYVDREVIAMPRDIES